MNKNAHIIAISHEKLSSMTADELREAMEMELDKIAIVRDEQMDAVKDDYAPYIDAAEKHEKYSLLLMECIDNLEPSDLDALLRLKGVIK